MYLDVTNRSEDDLKWEKADEKDGFLQQVCQRCLLATREIQYTLHQKSHRPLHLILHASAGCVRARYATDAASGAISYASGY